MTRRVVLSAVIVALLAVGWVSVCLASCPIPWFEGRGQVVIPGGQPVVGIRVNIYREYDSYYMGGVYTDDNGYWSYCFPYTARPLTSRALVSSGRVPRSVFARR